MKTNILNYSLEKLELLLCNKYDQKKFRATQIFNWIYGKNVLNFNDMSDISSKFRTILDENFVITLPKISIKQTSSDETVKFLTQFDDGNKVETVIMKYKYGNVLCVSSQVGCAMGCSFCASGLLTKVRNLEVGEMIGQLYLANNILKEKNERITHIVIMGTGEPFDNYDNVMDFIRISNSCRGFEIGARHISVSTCGIPSKIRDFANEGLQVNLAISLHAPNNDIRNQLMKINKAFPLEELMEAVKYYESKTKRRVTFEYILLKDINDSRECASQLATLIKGTLAYVNIIPYNKVSESIYDRSEKNVIDSFYKMLNRIGVNCTIRKEFGKDIDAACGQLRAKTK